MHSPMHENIQRINSAMTGALMSVALPEVLALSFNPALHDRCKYQ